ncbi:MAG: phosphatidylserine decarboxylase [Myxococcales bacterium]|nr:phosphatidylserine decarboxylase [Myxococcales bacterium]
MAVDAIHLAPKSAFSGVVGWGARRELPRALRAPIYGAFASVVGAELGEVEHSLGDYKSLAAFFSRGLKSGARTLPDQTGDWAAPCDCKVAEAGSLADRVLYAKGQSFSLTSLLASERLSQELRSGEFLTLYLSPRDYHRVHAPTDCRLLGYQYIPGSLYPVAPFYRRHIDNIFAVNERIVLELECDAGVFALVMVGACGVGNMRLTQPALESRHLRPSVLRPSVFPGSSEGDRDVPHKVKLSEPIPLARGQELGAFELGSTVILCTPEGAVDIQATIGDALQFGDVIATASSAKPPGEEA